MSKSVGTFRPRARLLQLLGDQLIGSPRLAVFELVKNSYDAGAKRVEVSLHGLKGDEPQLVVVDDGSGMTRETLEQVWLVPGHDHRGLQRARGERGPLGRLPLGEKGVGRFAAHKLGNLITVVTRAANEDEHVVEINWDELTEHEFLDQAQVTIHSRSPKVFVNRETGTRITIAELRGERWSRGETRRLARQITSISSPFNQRSDDFTASLHVPEHPEWLANVPTVHDLVARAPWSYRFTLIDNVFEWEYTFHGIDGVGAEPRTLTGSREGILLDPAYLPERDGRSSVASELGSQVGIGEIRGNLYVFDRDRAVLRRMGDSQGIESFLNENGGIRVYRDGIRVYNYGEPGDDWLGLDLRRVNAPAKRISQNIVVGAVDLSLADSWALREKTNREGFEESREYRMLQALVIGAVDQFETERLRDKNIIRQLLKTTSKSSDRDISRPLERLRKSAKRHGISNELNPLIEAAETSYADMREIMLRAGTSNMTLVVVYHEIEHGVRLILRALEEGASGESVLPQARDLLGLLDGFGDLLRKGQKESHDLRVVLRRAIDLNRIRLRNHHVELDSNLGEIDAALPTTIPLGLVLGALTNLIDNSVYWLRTKYPDDDEGRRKIYLGVDENSFREGPAIIVADNGPGFLDDLSEVTQPFFSRRPDGIGVGLYYVNLIMGLCGGRVLELGENFEGTVPTGYDGAALALVFERG